MYFELTLVRANQLFAPAQLPKNAFGSPTVSGAQYPETSVPLLALPGQIFECIDVLDHDAPLLEPPPALLACGRRGLQPPACSRSWRQAAPRGRPSSRCSSSFSPGVAALPSCGSCSHSRHDLHPKAHIPGSERWARARSYVSLCTTTTCRPQSRRVTTLIDHPRGSQRESMHDPASERRRIPSRHSGE